jgi:Fe2+ or Zn2+ uptake regulation protein
MQPQDERLTGVVEAILRYLHSHPDAADTVEGIAKWWLPANWCVDACTVQSALARLEAQGLVHRRTNADAHELYSL